MIRNAASQAIVAFLGILEPKNWPECLQHLFNMLESPSLEQQEVRHHIPVPFTLPLPILGRLRATLVNKSFIMPGETFLFQTRPWKFRLSLLTPRHLLPSLGLLQRVRQGLRRLPSKDGR